MIYEDLRGSLLALMAVAIVSAGCGGESSDGTDTGATMTTVSGSGGDGMMDTTADGSGDGAMTGGMPVCNETPTTSFATDIQPIIEATCVEGCHTADGGQWLTFPLDGGAAANYADLVGVPGPTQPLPGGDVNLVEPCDPENSYLMAKLEGRGTDLGAAAGLLQMPLTGSGTDADPWIETPLPADQLALIETWILDGAPE